jgi:hypothetical protein
VIYFLFLSFPHNWVSVFFGSGLLKGSRAHNYFILVDFIPWMLGFEGELRDSRNKSPALQYRVSSPGFCDEHHQIYYQSTINAFWLPPSRQNDAGRRTTLEPGVARQQKVGTTGRRRSRSRSASERQKQRRSKGERPVPLFFFFIMLLFYKFARPRLRLDAFH